MKTAYVFLADGFEEIEAFTPIDFLARAGQSLQRVGVQTREVRSNSGTNIITDCSLSELGPVDAYDLLVLPGGAEGAKNLSENAQFIELLRSHNSNGGIIASLCISPAWVLGRHGLLAGKKYTCYPGGEKDVDDSTATWVDAPVVRDGTIITSRGIGTAAQFAAVLVSIMAGEEAARKIWNSTLQGMCNTEFPML